MTRMAAMLPFLPLLLLSAASSRAENAAKPLGGPVLEPPTLRCLGAYWIVQGDENRNASVAVHYRQQGAEEWKQAPELFRVEKGRYRDKKHKSTFRVPSGAWLFAGSIFVLKPDTAYELKATLSDPDGGEGEKILKCRTAREPKAPPGMKTHYVMPGNGGGSGTKGDPFQGLKAAQEKAKPGDLFLLGKGIYEGTFLANQSGTLGKPIIWRGAGMNKTILDARGKAKKEPERALSAGDIHDVWFEDFTLRNAKYSIVAHRSYRMVFRRLHIHECEYGITWTGNQKGQVRGNFVTDCVIEGRATWPRTKGIEGRRGIQATGAGHVIAYNRIRGFADAMDTFPSPRCAAIDFHNNEISECTDDGIEMDYSQRNTRCFFNRLTNCFQGISTQPVFGGPVYIFRNAMYNVVQEPFKMHNNPSGALMVHNTSVKSGMPLVLYTQKEVSNCLYRNNLFIGTQANYAYESTAPMLGCDFDYDGFGGGPWRDFLKWNKVRYKTLEEVKKKAPVYKHAVLVDPATAFASGITQPADAKKQFKIAVNDLRLKEGTAAMDAGQALPGFNGGFQGKAPDLGAYEFGQPLPHYGPRPRKP